QLEVPFPAPDVCK
ncbi:hypothetical protein D030_1365B, partial [Vibrio parahaemolyticus AQ3810]